LLLLVNPDEFSERSVLQIAAKLFGNRPSHGPAKREDAGEFKRAAICEFNGRTLTEYPPDAPLLHRDAPPGQSRPLRVVGDKAVVDQKRGWTPVGQHQGMMHGERTGGQDADRAAFEFVTVTIRAVEDRGAPPIGEARNVRQDIDDATGEYQPLALEGVVVRLDVKPLLRASRL
jgi:hypothetical protein